MSFKFKVISMLIYLICISLIHSVSAMIKLSEIVKGPTQIFVAIVSAVFRQLCAKVNHPMKLYHFLLVSRIEAFHNLNAEWIVVE